MPTPDPSNTFYIEINDFSPGVFADRFGSDPPRFTADQNARASHVRVSNGMARAHSTLNCRADRFGALVPMPRALATGARDTITPGLGLQPMRPFRYVLDAQIGDTLVDASEVAADLHTETSRQVLQIMWGFYVTPEA